MRHVPEKPGTLVASAVGVARSGSPNWPWLPSPQQYTSRKRLSAQAWLAPATSCIASEMPVIGVPSVSADAAPSERPPIVPQQLTVPVLSRAQPKPLPTRTSAMPAVLVFASAMAPQHCAAPVSDTEHEVS